MITADKVQKMISMPLEDLTSGIKKAGYKNDSFVYAKFVGISNGNEFVYNVGVAVKEAVKNRKVVVKYSVPEQAITVGY